MARILIVEDNPTMREGLEQMLGRAGHQVAVAPDADHALALSQDQAFDLVITDYKMDGMTGLELLDAIRQGRAAGQPDVMLITAFGTIDIAVEAMRRGATDFITKPFDTDELKVKVNRALETRDLRRERDQLRAETEYLREEVEHHFGDIVGVSSSMRSIFGEVRKVAEANSSVYIYGEIESQNPRSASAVSIVLLTISFAMLLIVDASSRRPKAERG